MRKIFFLFVISILFSGCIEPSSTSVGEGELLLQLQVGSISSRFSTISPNLDIERYVIEFESYNGESTDKEDVVLTESSSSISLAVGTWDVTIYAEDSASIRIAELNIEGIEIVKSVESNIEAMLLPVAGTGALSIILDISSKPDDVTIESVSWLLEKGISSPIEINSGVLTEPYLVSLSDLQSGTDYRLVFEITTDSGYLESEGIVYVFSDKTTTDTVVLSTADFGEFANIIIADHTVVDRYDDIPSEWIAEVKKMLLIVGGESHGRAYNYGLELLGAQNDSYAVSTQWDAVAPESYTDQHLRSTRSYRFGSNWSTSMGEEDCFTSETAIANVKTGLTYIATNYEGVIVQGFGWCWDMTWGNSATTEKDPVYGCGWAGASKGTPEDPLSTYGLPWGLDSGDYDITGNTVCMQTYLDAVSEYNIDEPRIVFIYTTGPVDGYDDERGYQRYLKHEYIREYVSDNGGVLFDYADILGWDYDAKEYTTTEWDSHVFQIGNPALAPGGTGYDGGDGGCHISEDGCLQLGKALWWMLARISGWEG